MRRLEGKSRPRRGEFLRNSQLICGPLNRPRLFRVLLLGCAPSTRALIVAVARETKIVMFGYRLALSSSRRLRQRGARRTV